ncbi:MAG: hypothetical protein HYX94_05135 [Chloroflexi bacterium]|nr:hypothetical protein [Chloroflexota bacterium]
MRRTRFVHDLGELLVFGAGLWGAVALLSLLLPIANAIVKAIPLQPQAVVLGTALAILMAFFALVYSFTEKSQILEFEMRRPFFRGEIINPRRDMLHNSVSRLAWGMISLSAYIALNALHGVVEQNSAEAGKWLLPILEPISVILYATAFALVTGAFGALAVMQYTRPQKTEPKRGSINLGVRDDTRVLTADNNSASSPDGVDEAHSQQ